MEWMTKAHYAFLQSNLAAPIDFWQAREELCKGTMVVVRVVGVVRISLR